MIRILAFLVLLASLAPSALAADTAERRIIGFSPDGQWFAFEEYGIADGTGAPYASIYVINTDKDIWAPGTPVRASFGEEPGPVSKALAAVHKKAGPVLERYSIREPGILLASKPVTMISTNARRIDFFRNRNVTGPAKRLSYVLKETDFPDSQSCKDAGIDVKGFSLFITKGGSPLTQVYKDKSIPVSRTCPMKYTISDVIEYAAPGGPVRHIVLVHMFVRGFEGADARFLAIPVTLP